MTSIMKPVAKKVVITIERELDSLTEEPYFLKLNSPVSPTTTYERYLTQAEIVRDIVEEELHSGNLNWKVQEVRNLLW